jgi:hypothetical protein
MSTPNQDLTPQQRLAQVAAILALGALRLKRATIIEQSNAPEELSESAQGGLESGANPRLSESRRFGF